MNTIELSRDEYIYMLAALGSQRNVLDKFLANQVIQDSSLLKQNYEHQRKQIDNLLHKLPIVERTGELTIKLV